jgi:hypothetical protein
MQNKKYQIYIGIIIIILIALSYSSIDSFLSKKLSNEENIQIERVIDGDTVVDVNGLHYRMLGINTPEKGEYIYEEAKKFTEEKVMNVSLIAEKKGKDLYDRELAYLYNGNENINKEIVEEGYASYYFPEGKDAHYEEFAKAWDDCLKVGKNLCEKSSNKCAVCIELSEWDFNSQIVLLHNRCGFDCSLNGWTIKDEGRKKYTFGNYILKSSKEVSLIVENKTDTNDKLYWKGETYVWTYTGDSLFLRDDKGKLVLWETKGY